jgi:hypothetical protein
MYEDDDGDSIKLSESEIEFLKCRFRTEDPDDAVEQFIEHLVLQGDNPLNLNYYVQKMMRKYQC